MNIVVERRPDKLYVARAVNKGDVAKPSAAGKSAGEALGSFLIRNSNRFGVSIEYRFEKDEEKEEKSE